MMNKGPRSKKESWYIYRIAALIGVRSRTVSVALFTLLWLARMESLASGSDPLRLSLLQIYLWLE